MYIQIPNEQASSESNKEKLPEKNSHEEENLRETRMKREPIVVWVTPDSGIMNNSML